MDSLKSRSIIQNAFALNYYPRKHIDAPTLSLLRQSIPVGGNRSDLSNPLINLLDGYLGITGQSITYLSLFKNTANELFSGFIGALLCETFVATSRSTRDNYVRTILKTLKAISFNIPNLTSDIDRGTALILWREMRICPLQREYYQGWAPTVLASRLVTTKRGLAPLARYSALATTRRVRDQLSRVR